MSIRVITTAALVAGLTQAAASPAPQATKPGRPFLLVSLPALGTVTWRCRPSRQGLALAFRAFRTSATDSVRLHVAKRTVLSRVVQPGQTLQLPFLVSRRQQLDIVQATQPGTLRAFLAVELERYYSYCESYFSPTLELRVTDQRN